MNTLETIEQLLIENKLKEHFKGKNEKVTLTKEQLYDFLIKFTKLIKENEK